MMRDTAYYRPGNSWRGARNRRTDFWSSYGMMFIAYHVGLGRSVASGFSAVCRLAIVLIVASPTVFRGFSCRADDRLERLAVDGAEAVRAIESIAFTQEHEGVYGPAQEAIPRTLMHCQLQAGDFRVEHLRALPPGDEAVPYKVFAFDGRRYQAYDNTLRRLSHSGSESSHPYGDPIILVEPYGWLFAPGEPKTWSRIRDMATWDHCFEHAVFADVGTLDGMRCHIVDVSWPSAEHRARVYFASDFGEYPVKSLYLTDDGKELGFKHVTEFKKLEAHGRRTLIPISFTFKQLTHDRGVAIARHCHIVKDSLQINQPIDKDVFVISSVRAMEVRDRDKDDPPTRLHGNPELAILEARDGQGDDMQSLIILCNVVVAVVVMILLGRKYLIRSRSRQAGD